jgi:hypothetical protein
MASMTPRMKWVAEMDNARLHYSDIATILGHEIMAGKLCGSSLLKWYGDISESDKNDVMFSVLAASEWTMCYPKGKKTCFQFRSVKHPSPVAYRNGKEIYDYMFWAYVPQDAKDTIHCVLFSRDLARDKVIASIDLDLDYFDFLGSLDFGGTDEQWDLVED